MAYSPTDIRTRFNIVLIYQLQYFAVAVIGIDFDGIAPFSACLLKIQTPAFFTMWLKLPCHLHSSSYAFPFTKIALYAKIGRKLA